MVAATLESEHHVVNKERQSYQQGPISSIRIRRKGNKVFVGIADNRLHVPRFNLKDAGIVVTLAVLQRDLQLLALAAPAPRALDGALATGNRGAKPQPARPVSYQEGVVSEAVRVVHRPQELLFAALGEVDAQVGAVEAAESAGVLAANGACVELLLVVLDVVEVETELAALIRKAVAAVTT